MRRLKERAMVNTPNGLDEVIATFGDIRKFIRSDGTLKPAWEEQHIKREMLPETLPLSGTSTVVTRVTCHELLVDALRNTLRAIDDAGKWKLLVSYGGGFNFRP